MKKKKILLAYASYGSGHKSAAKYIENYFLNQKNNYEIKILDISDYNTSFGKLAESLYSLNFKHNAGYLFTLIYKFFNHKVSTLPYKKFTEKLYNQERLQKAISDFNPDLTISTHFFVGILISKYNKMKIINSKILTVLTDYKSHEIWTRNFKNEDGLIVGNEIIKNELIEEGLDKNKIYPFGIPLSEKFKSALNKEETYKRYNLKKDMLTISFLNGSVGSANSYDYLKSLLKKRYNVQIIMFCGKNETLRNKCLKLIEEKKYKNIIVLPFTNDVNNLLNISDLVITKPGGLSTTECLELKKPMMLIPGNGGPETYNAKFLVLNGFAIKNINLIKFSRNMKKIIKHPNIIKNMQNKLNNYETNTSVIKLYNLSKKLLKK